LEKKKQCSSLSHATTYIITRATHVDILVAYTDRSEKEKKN